DLFFSGVRPAINAGFSVSRVGGSAQIKAMKKVAGTLRLDLASYRELESFAQFGSDLDEFTARKLERGKRTVEVLKQGQGEPLPVQNEVLIIYALVNGFLDDIPVQDVQRFEAEIISWTKNNAPEILDEIKTKGTLPDKEKMNSAIENFKRSFSISEE
ncbi:F0F1 ATP synthase subunit alpha, partial [Burkholderia multivorans]